MANGSSLNEVLDGNTPLLWSSINGHLEVMKYLLRNGASIEEKNNDDLSSIEIACMCGHLDIVMYLHQNGCSITERNKFSQGTCLLYAAHKGQLDIIKYLLANGSSIDEKSKSDSSITLASAKGHLETIKWLVTEKGCSLQEMNTKGTCIMNAAKSKHFDCVVWMLHNGSSLDENTCIDHRGIIFQVASCKDILVFNGLYETVKKALTTKSSRK